MVRRKYFILIVFTLRRWDPPNSESNMPSDGISSVANIHMYTHPLNSLLK